MKNTSLQVLKHLLVGGCAFAIHFLCLIILVSYELLPTQMANMVSFFIAFSFSYNLQCKWVYQKNTKSYKKLCKYLVSQLVFSFATNQVLFITIDTYTRLNYKIICFIACTIVAVLTFIMNKFWVFK